MSRCFDEIKEEREAEIEAMIKYIKDFEEAKEFLRCVYWLNYRLMDNNDNLRQWNEEYEEEIEALKKRYEEKIEEFKKFAYECECNKHFVECQRENEELKKQLKDLQEKEKVFSKGEE